MDFFSALIHQPRRLFLRKTLFQVHLWAGVLLSLYIVVIALSGAVLVFEDELIASTLPASLHGFEPGRLVPLSQVTARFQAEFPTATLSSISVPTPDAPVFQLVAAKSNGLVFSMAADPQTGELYQMPRTYVDWIRDLHLYLLLPRSYGNQVNGVGAGVLLLLALSGLTLWWPGLRSWSRGLRVDFRANWRRINFDLHNAIGIWSLGLISWWAVSGLYFGFERQVAAAVNFFSPLRNMIPPIPLPAAQSTARLSLQGILQSAQAASPAGHLYSLSDPLLRAHSVVAEMDLGRPGDFSHRDIVELDTATGRILSLWHNAETHSLGDWVLWSMRPLHFGTLFGMPAKMLWATFGVGLATLSVTGLLMYWNRFLRHRWRCLKTAR